MRLVGLLVIMTTAVVVHLSMVIVMFNLFGMNMEVRAVIAMVAMPGRTLPGRCAGVDP